jgi:flagellar hook-basal body complex protein FliE
MNNIAGLRILPADVPYTPATRVGGGGETSFSEMLDKAVFNVDQLQAAANEKVGSMLGGNTADVHDAMIAVQKADLSFQLMMQVRNKVVQAYQEIERMQF